MAMQQPPDMPAIIDYGSAPEFFVDGLAHYSEDTGLVRMSFYSLQPVLDGSGEMVRIVSLRLVCTIAIERDMRKAIFDMTAVEKKVATPHPRKN